MAKLQYPARNYSKLYQPPEESSGDKLRVRRRMAVAFSVAAEENHYAVLREIEAELGIEPPSISYNSYVDWRSYLEAIEWSDFLSTFSILLSVLMAKNSYTSVENAKKLRSKLRRIFAEENVLLSLGNDDIIHPKIDTAFERLHETLIRGLEGKKYEAVREHLSKLEAALVSDPVDGAEAIRRVHLAAENVVKQMFTVERLSEAPVRKKLRQLIGSIYPEGSTERKIASEQIEGFCIWMKGANFYRHEDGDEKPTQPTEEISFLAVSDGLSFLRWLVSIREIRP